MAPREQGPALQSMGAGDLAHLAPEIQVAKPVPYLVRRSVGMRGDHGSCECRDV